MSATESLWIVALSDPISAMVLGFLFGCIVLIVVMVLGYIVEVFENILVHFGLIEKRKLEQIESKHDVGRHHGCPPHHGVDL